MENQNESKNRVLIGLAIVELVIIVILLFFFFRQKNEIQENRATIDTQSDRIQKKEAELVDLMNQYEQLKKEREALGLSNDSLNMQIEKLGTSIRELRSTKKISESRLKELNSMIETMKLDLEEKDKQIAALVAKNDSLSTNITTLEEEKTQMRDTISTLVTKVSTAEILEAENIKVVAVKENGKEIDDADREFKLRRIDKIRVKFNLDENNIAEHNQKEVYLAFVTPTGETFSDPNTGGGETMVDGQATKYTIKQVISFDNSKQKLTFDMYRGFEYLPGLHAVELYCEGHKIGTESFVIKK